MTKNKKNNFKIALVLFILLISTYLRFHNINYEGFWTDEIFAFYTSEPNITFKETLIRTLDSNFNSLFDFSLKKFHSIFGYDVHTSRYFSLLLSFLTLATFTILLSKITNYSSLIFGLYILSINIFHIRYSTEVRSYILTFLLAIIFIYLNFKDKDNEHKLTLKRLSLIIFTSILMILSHAFTLLILGSFILFKILKILKNKKIHTLEITLILGLVSVCMLYLFVYLPINIKYADQLIGLSPHWIKQVKLSFYTNFFFSQYFGSRILGLIYLIILIFIIFKFKRTLLEKLNIYSFFVILIFCSYAVPLIYGYLFGPVLIGRYIMFILIPIICLIAHFIFLINNNLIKYLFLVLIIFTTSLNHIFFENTFKQFYTNINFTKPQLRDALKTIDVSTIKNFSVKKVEAKEKNLNESYENYVKKYLEKLGLEINYINYESNKNVPKKFWLIDIRDAYKEELILTRNLNDYKIDKKLYFNSLELILLVKNN